MAAVRQVQIDARLLDQTRRATSPSAEASDTETVERALRIYLGCKAMHEAQAMSDLTEEQALDLAYSELHAMRASRRVA